MYLQGISYWNGTYELVLTDKDMQVRFGLKMVLECWDREFLGTTTIFQKNDICWPQQPPTELVYLLVESKRAPTFSYFSFPGLRSFTRAETCWDPCLNILIPYYFGFSWCDFSKIRKELTKWSYDYFTTKKKETIWDNLRGWPNPKTYVKTETKLD